jgi:hypothetical protein
LELAAVVGRGNAAQTSVAPAVGSVSSKLGLQNAGDVLFDRIVDVA